MAVPRWCFWCGLLFVWYCGCSLRDFLFRALSASLSFCQFSVMSSIVMTFFWEKVALLYLICDMCALIGLCTVCIGLLSLPLGVIGRLYDHCQTGSGVQCSFSVERRKPS